MIKVGFPVLGSSAWWAGITYLYNLLYSLSLLEKGQITPVVLCRKNIDASIISLYEPYADIVQYSGELIWYLSRGLRKLSVKDIILDRYLIKNDIKVISHLTYPLNGSARYKTITWIPDFQHIHLPLMFSSREIRSRNHNYSRMAKKSDAVIVSSHDALKDLRSFVPQYAHKARVLNFVAQPNPLVFTTDRAIAEKKFGIDRKYFYLPNQFWKHKNHIVVFEAIKLLKMKEPAVLLVCSGSMSDYRNIDHMQFLVDFVRSNDLEDNIKLLGMIDQIDLFSLMRNSISVINPSLFEGWSTTVEECKSLGKNMILSDIPVHREQNPPGAKYFSPRDPHELEHLLYHEYRNSSGGPDLTLETLAASCLKKRCREYAETYQGIVLDVLQ